MTRHLNAEETVILCADAELQFASYYGDHMVLQKSPERAVLWGYGPQGARVTVFLSGLQLKNFSASVSQGEFSQLLTGGRLMLTETPGPSSVLAVSAHFSRTGWKLHNQLLRLTAVSVNSQHRHLHNCIN